MRGQTQTLLCFSFLGVLGLLVPIGIWTKGQNPELANLNEAELKQVVIHLERSTCYGSCPAYKLTIHGDGRVEYEGTKFVKVTAKKEATIKPAEVARLVSEFAKAGYFSIEQFSEAECHSCTVCTDMPTVTTEIQAKGATHRVVHYYGCQCAPKALWELEAAIDKIVRTEQWTGDVSKQGPLGTTCFRR